MKKYCIILIILIIVFDIIEPVITSIANIQHEIEINKKVEISFNNLNIPEEEIRYINMDYLKDDIRAFYNDGKYHAIKTEESSQDSMLAREVYVGEGYRLEENMVTDVISYSVVSVKTNKLYGTIVRGEWGMIYRLKETLIKVIRILIILIEAIFILRLLVMVFKKYIPNSNLLK